MDRIFGSILCVIGEESPQNFKIMKKYLFILTAVIFAATSCTKDEVYETQKDTTPDYAEFAVENGGGYTSIDCFGKGNGCYVLDTIVITPNQIADVNNAIVQGPGAIGSLFNDPVFANLLNGIDPINIVNIQSGTYNMAVFYDDLNWICFYVGQSPILDASNAEFSFRLHK